MGGSPPGVDQRPWPLARLELVSRVTRRRGFLRRHSLWPIGTSAAPGSERLTGAAPVVGVPRIIGRLAVLELDEPPPGIEPVDEIADHPPRR